MGVFHRSLALAGLVLSGAPVVVAAGDPPAGDPPPSLAAAAPRSPAPRLYTNADLPSRPQVSVIGTGTPAPTLEQLLELLPPPPAEPIRPPEAPREPERRPETSGRFEPPGRLPELIGARGAACVFGTCPDGRPPLAPLVPWSGAEARDAIRRKWSRPVVSPVRRPPPSSRAPATGTNEGKTRPR